MKTFTKQEIDDLCAELRKELPDLVKSETESLVKTEGKVFEPDAEANGGTESKGKVIKAASGEAPGDEKGPNKSLTKDEPKGDSADDEKSAPAKDASASSESSDSAPAADAKPDASAVAPADAGAASADPAQAQGTDQSLEQQYAALSDEELHAHFEALKSVIMSKMPQDPAAQGTDPMASAAPAPGAPGADASAVPPAPASPAAAPAPAMDAASASAPAPVVDKSAGMAPMAPAQQPLLRSEKELEELLAKSEKASAEKVDKLQEQINGLTNLLTEMIQPKQRAVTSMVEFVAKSESQTASKPLSKEQIAAKLKEVSFKGSDLKKSDRELINRYFLSGDIDIKQIEHLLK